MPYVGQIVLVYDSLRSGFDPEHLNPGIITKVHANGNVNVKVFSDVAPAYDAEDIGYEVFSAERYCKSVA